MIMSRHIQYRAVFMYSTIYMYMVHRITGYKTLEKLRFYSGIFYLNKRFHSVVKVATHPISR